MPEEGSQLSDIGQRITEYVLGFIPEPLRATPQAVELVGNVTATLQQLAAALRSCDLWRPDSIERLEQAAHGHRMALHAIETWGAELRAAADEARGATAH